MSNWGTASESILMQSEISIRGAREHNLKNVNLDIPRDELVVITGLSGSGKSSLAFDTLYAEGQRRYVESLSSYARQFLQLMQKPDVDSIEGLSPAISIEQKTTSKNPRSTVGTVTEIYDYLRLLFARVGIPYSPTTGKPIKAQTVSQMVDTILTMPEGTRLLLLAPLVRGRKGEYKKELVELRKQGFQRVIIDGEMHSLETPPALNKNYKHTIEVVVDRVIVRADVQQRLADSIETALRLADGLLYIQNADSEERQTFSAKFACPESGFTLDEIEPRIFSFNSPYGACETCDGLGVRTAFDIDLLIPDKTLSLRDGAIHAWKSPRDKGSKRQRYMSDYYNSMIDDVCRYYDVSVVKPWEDLHDSFRQIILYGSGKEEIPWSWGSTASRKKTRVFEGVLPNLERRWRETESDIARHELSKYQTAHPCPDCDGHRLRPATLCVKIAGQHIGQITDMSIEKAYEWFNSLKLSEKDQQIAERILKEIRGRLGFLVNVGLGYLTMSRASGTLSGGESQRIRLASQIGSGLTGVLYVLDEPSIGLHQRDNDRLLQTLKYLRDLGNTVVVVEHDEDAIRSADYVVDMGPRAGAHGGEVIAQGTPAEVMANSNSLTGQYLSGAKSIELPNQRRELKTGNSDMTLRLYGAKANNLKSVDVTFPLGGLISVTGVSGGGKSSLVVHTLYKALAQKINGSRELPGSYSRIEGVEYIDKIIDIDQSPIGRTPRSNPATYIGCFTLIREWFAGLPEAKARGYAPGRFSFNVKGGRCEACQGDGMIKIEMHFLPDVYVKCDQCEGRRYNRETLEIKYKGKSIADVLDMTVDEAVEFFDAHPGVRSRLETLQKVGLGYIHVGQQATTLSGGEAQRVKLAKELSRRATGRTFYILDEPTTGLHFEDVRKLLEVLQALVDQGNTIVVIEHNLEVIKTSDWVIDLGPEGGAGGGRIVATGTPEQVAEVSASHTGHYLKPYLGKQPDEQNGSAAA